MADVQTSNEGERQTDLLPEGIGLLDDDKTWVCVRCDSLVSDPDLHAAWHKESL